MNRHILVAVAAGSLLLAGCASSASSTSSPSAEPSAVLRGAVSGLPKAVLKDITIDAAGASLAFEKSTAGKLVANYNAVAKPMSGSTVGAETSWKASAQTNSKSPITIAGLTLGTTYRFSLRTVYVNGSYQESEKDKLYALAPSAPGIGTVTLSDTTATVPFTAPASDNGSPITSYTATSTPGGLTASVNQSSAGSITVTGLSYATAYTFTVTAVNSLGSTASSPSNSVTPVAPVAPGAPAIGAASLNTAGTDASVAFTAPASDGGAPITTYTATSTPGSKTGTSTTGSPIIVSGLTNGTAYTFTVTATNSKGTSPASAASNSVNNASGVGVVISTSPGLEVAPAGWYGTSNDPSLTWDDAVAKAAAYQGGGKTGWHLPTRGELTTLYGKKNLVSGLFSGNQLIWSGDKKDWLIRYSMLAWSGGIYDRQYNEANTVRPVRTF